MNSAAWTLALTFAAIAACWLIAWIAIERPVR